jgi:hypothetical protein
MIPQPRGDEPARQFLRTRKGRAYLDGLGDALPYRFSGLQSWLSETCPQCGWNARLGDPAALDRHAAMSAYVVVDCAGLPTVNPNEVGVLSPGWVDRTLNSANNTQREE